MFRNAALIAVLCVGTMVVAQDGAKKKNKQKGKKIDAASMNAVCPMSGGKVDNTKFANFGGGKVYFCCDKCVTNFNTMKAKMNHQLVQTGQLKQVACPISGHDLVEGNEVEVAGVKVGFCCENCKGAAEKLVAKDKDAAVLAYFNGKHQFKSFKTQRQINQQIRRDAGKKEKKSEAGR
jgi:YHS domain-containing protein